MDPPLLSKTNESLFKRLVILEILKCDVEIDPNPRIQQINKVGLQLFVCAAKIIMQLTMIMSHDMIGLL